MAYKLGDWDGNLGSNGWGETGKETLLTRESREMYHFNQTIQT